MTAAGLSVYQEGARRCISTQSGSGVTPTAWYKLEEATGTTRNDSSGNALHLTDLQSDVSTGTGKVGNCASFDTSGTSKLSRSTSTEQSTWDIGAGISLSVCAWFRVNNGISTIQPVIQRTNGDWTLKQNTDGTFDFRITDSAAAEKVVTSTTVAALNTWYWVCGIFDNVGNTVKIYVNNEEQASTAMTNDAQNSSPTTFQIVTTWVNPNVALIDEVMVIKEALTAAQRATIYNGGSGTNDPLCLPTGVASGGTGLATVAAGSILFGADTSAMTALASPGDTTKFLRGGATGSTGPDWATPLDITGLTAADPALDDELPTYDISAGANRKVTYAKLGFLLTGLVGGRLTLTSGTSVTTADVTAAGTLYYAIHEHDKIALYDGTRWKMYTFTERSLALTVTSGKNYDVFLYDNAGTLTLELSAAWTTDVARADALTTVDGVRVKSGATTRRYLGTIRASGTNTVDDSGYPAAGTTPKRFVWNAYNRVRRAMVAKDSTDSWTYNSTTYRSANASNTNRLEFVQGLDEDAVEAMVLVFMSGGTGGGGTVGIDLDGTTGNDSQTYGETQDTANAAVNVSHYDANVGIGYHFLQWVEAMRTSANATFYGDGAVPTFVQSAIRGTIRG